MKFSLALCGLVVAAALPGVGSASTCDGCQDGTTRLTYNFLDGHPNQNIEDSHVFFDNQGNHVGVTASIVDGRQEFDLYEKNMGGDETGLGIVAENRPNFPADHELTAGVPASIALNLSNLLPIATSIDIRLNSNTGRDRGVVVYLGSDYDADDHFTISDENWHSLNLAELREKGSFQAVLVGAEQGDVLIGGLRACVTPEPADSALVGLGLLAAGCLFRRFTKKS